ncbi:hypothetical protein B0J11DRAFT_521820 [Dendryphion nanum]|uniref:RRM domain-containing protein n=1 Tax=Dendryphion nanum TaxID=256645 RepID=A0A9P9E6U8_9PLEO|nr:hypothetical protein B0J11DRAFT_521820 [Dendryphion nanum]
MTSGTVSNSNPPNKTLYCRNLPEKLPKDDLKRNLYMLFATYGVILDVIALKTTKMRGQAHIVFRDVDAATQAMRALHGFNFFGKDMQIAYAKGTSNTFAKLAGTFSINIPQADVSNSTEQRTTAQESVFGSAPAPTKAKPLNEPEDNTKGIKRGRDESEAEDEDDDGDAMDVSDSD